MAGCPKKHRRSWKDPLVDVVGLRVRAALDRVGLSNRETVRQLAEIGIVIQNTTLDYITASPQHQKRCRRSLVKGLVRLFAAHGIPGSRVTETWLTGEEKRPAFVPEADMLDSSGSGGEEHYVDRPGLFIDDQPPAEQLILNEFMARCHAAIVRDLHGEYGDGAVKEYGEWGYALLFALVALVDSCGWRHGCLRTDIPDSSEYEFAGPGTAELVAAWEVILSPWFAGESLLHLPAIWNLLLVVDHPDSPVFPNEMDKLKQMAERS